MRVVVTGWPRFGWGPRWAVELLAGKERAEEVLFSSQRVVPAKLLAAGYTFRHPDIHEALADAVGPRSPDRTSS